MSPLRMALMAATLALLSPLANAAEESVKHGKAGFVTFVEDGRLWVFKEKSPELEDFKKHGEPTKMATRIGAGPEGMTIRAADVETIDAFLAKQ